MRLIKQKQRRTWEAPGFKTHCRNNSMSLRGTARLGGFMGQKCGSDTSNSFNIWNRRVNCHCDFFVHVGSGAWLRNSPSPTPNHTQKRVQFGEIFLKKYDLRIFNIPAKVAPIYWLIKLRPYLFLGPGGIETERKFFYSLFFCQTSNLFQAFTSMRTPPTRESWQAFVCVKSRKRYLHHDWIEILGGCNTKSKEWKS